ncbi:MAG: NAD-dependent epimerase/dehydratase family protein [Candidatus Hodarchaeales archaeon]|jgi:nucleoside-diphosphate-sugar epimerase
MKALVTGGGGFLGRYIVEQLLERGDSVIAFSRKEYPELVNMGAKSIKGNIQDYQTLSKACVNVDVVFHVAALAGMWGSWKSFYNTNVLGTENVIKVCIDQKVSKLIYTSSPSVIFSNEPQENINESIPYPKKYESFYAKSKAMGEKLVIEANSESLLTCSLRPHLIFGPRDPHLLVTIVKRAQEGKLPQIGKGDNKVDFSYVVDAARAHLLAADSLIHGSRLAGSVYFISQDEPVELWPWLNHLFSELNIPPVRKKYSLRMARSLGAILEILHRILPFLGEPRITRFLASELALSHYYDISKAKNDFGYHTLFDMETAVSNTLEYLKKYLE